MMMAAMMPAVALAETNSNSAPVSVEANDHNQSERPEHRHQAGW